MLSNLTLYHHRDPDAPSAGHPDMVAINRQMTYHGRFFDYETNGDTYVLIS